MKWLWIAEHDMIHKLAIRHPYRSSFYSTYITSNTTRCKEGGKFCRVFKPSIYPTIQQAYMKGVPQGGPTPCAGCQGVKKDIQRSTHQSASLLAIMRLQWLHRVGN